MDSAKMILEHLVVYGFWEIAITILVYLEWQSSKNLDQKLGKIMSKYIGKLEDSHYEIVKSLLSKRVHKKPGSNKKRDK